MDRTTREKYADTLSIISYIEDIYWIDAEHNALIPIDYSPIANDLTKSVKRKLKVYSEILKTFNSDEYTRVLVAMTNINNKVDDITYVIPESTCPVCGTHIAEVEMDPLAMVFERHQYVAVRDL